MWHDESDSVKTEWKSKAESVKRQHLEDHPDYQYQPRKPFEKKRRMTKRKTAVFAAGASSSTLQPPTQTRADALTSQHLVNLNSMEMPSFNYTANGQMATFTFDPAQQNQMGLFGEMIDNHNGLTMAPVQSAAAPAANTVLPTAAHNNQYHLEMSTEDIARAESELFNFEVSLEETLALELERMEKERVDDIPQAYNDLESQRFTDFLEQMPEHMWGMDLVN